MERELRKHPRVPSDDACALVSAESSQRVDGRTFCVATHGLGLWLADVETGIYVPGERVVVAIAVGREIAELGGTIAWIRRVPNRTLNVGIEFATSPVVAPASYLQWVGRRLTSLRAHSLALGGNLARQRKISLRTFQEALDQQARDGGDLHEHLQRLDGEENL